MTFCMRSSERLKEIARRNSSAFAAGEVGDDHRHLQHLFLEQGDAEGAFESGFEAVVDVIDGLLAVAAVEVGMHHAADDGAGADQRDLDAEVVELARLHASAGWRSGRVIRSGTCRWYRRGRWSRRWQGRPWGELARSTGRPRF